MTRFLLDLSRQRHTRLAAAALAALALAACGGGGDTDAASDTARAQQETTDGTTARISAAPVAPVGTLTLVSVLATGGGAPCATSADGNIVAFVDNSSGRNQVRVRNLRTGTLVLGSTSADGSALPSTVCRGMTPDGRYLVLDVVATSGSIFGGGSGRDAALFVKDLQTGSLTRATPQLDTLPTTRAFDFVGVSNDGQRVAFLGLPTTTYLGGYDLRADGPVRLLYRDLGSSQVVDLSSTARLEPNTASALPGVAAISGDGSRLAFISPAPFPEVGDSDALSDVLVLNLNNGSVTLASPDTGSASGFVWTRLYGFANADSRVVYEGNSRQPGGSRGIFSNTVEGQAVQVLASGSFNNVDFFGGAIGETLDFDDALQQVVFLRYNSQRRVNQPWLRNLRTGAEQRLDTTATGVLGNSFSTAPLIAADGTQVAFGSFATNLVRLGRFAPSGQVYSKTVGVANSTAQ